MADLAPCPFCGGAAEMERHGTGRVSCIVACTNCGVRHESSDTFNSGASWNQRIDTHTPADAPGAGEGRRPCGAWRKVSPGYYTLDLDACPMRLSSLRSGAWRWWRAGRTEHTGDGATLVEAQLAAEDAARAVLVEALGKLEGK